MLKPLTSLLNDYLNMKVSGGDLDFPLKFTRLIQRPFERWPPAVIDSVVHMTLSLWEINLYLAAVAPTRCYCSCSIYSLDAASRKDSGELIKEWTDRYVPSLTHFSLSVSLSVFIYFCHCMYVYVLCVFVLCVLCLLVCVVCLYVLECDILCTTQLYSGT